MANIFTSNGRYPGTKIALKDKYKRLYHFTSFDTFPDFIIGTPNSDT